MTRTQHIVAVMFPGLSFTEVMADPMCRQTFVSARIELKLPPDADLVSLPPQKALDTIFATVREQLAPLLHALGCDEDAVRADERKRIAEALDQRAKAYAKEDRSLVRLDATAYGLAIGLSEWVAKGAKDP